jgi:internalin A
LGGQEIMHATHQFFLTRRSLYLLVLSGREGGADQDAEYWLKLVESFGGESPVLVVLNKQREHPCEVNQRQLHGKYPFDEPGKAKRRRRARDSRVSGVKSLCELARER